MSSYNISYIKETLLVPRFYKTDFKALKQLNLKIFNLEINSLLKEHLNDYNKYHFIYNPTNTTTLKIKNKKDFIAFLLRSCLAEFSGYLLYTDILKNIPINTNKTLRKLFKLVARDEARHTGILNTYLNEFNFNLNLGNLTKNRPYTYFSPRYVYYSVFLSEKIGYWRYITMYRNLKNFTIKHPIFNYFALWCQDENRHGDFFSLLLNSNPHLLTGPLARLWTRFFLVVIFITMISNDIEKKSFFKSLKLETFAYDVEVIIKTNLIASKLFPVTLNLASPLFIKNLEQFLNTFIYLQGIKQTKNFTLVAYIKTLIQSVVLSSTLFLLYPSIRKKSLFKEVYI